MILEFHSTTKCGAKLKISIIEKSILSKKRIFISMIEHERNRQSTSSFGFIGSGSLSVDVMEKGSFDQSADRNQGEIQTADITKFITMRTLSMHINLNIKNTID